MGATIGARVYASLVSAKNGGKTPVIASICAKTFGTASSRDPGRRVLIIILHTSTEGQLTLTCILLCERRPKADKLCAQCRQPAGVHDGSSDRNQLYPIDTWQMLTQILARQALSQRNMLCIMHHRWKVHRLISIRLHKSQTYSNDSLVALRLLQLAASRAACMQDSRSVMTQQ